MADGADVRLRRLERLGREFAQAARGVVADMEAEWVAPQGGDCGVVRRELVEMARAAETAAVDLVVLTRLHEMIAEARAQAGISRRALARKAGVSAAFLNYVEAGQRVPGSKKLERIATVVGLDPREARDAAARARRRRHRDRQVADAATIREQCTAIAEVADDNDSEKVLAEKLAEQGLSERIVELRIASMRRAMGRSPAPKETHRAGRRAGRVALTWRRRFL